MAQRKIRRWKDGGRADTHAHMHHCGYGAKVSFTDQKAAQASDPFGILPKGRLSPRGVASSQRPSEKLSGCGVRIEL